jgi:uncharacterized protein (UPF0335 family)
MSIVTANQLKSYIERIERLNEEKSNTSTDIRDVFAEAKGNGYDPKIMREIIKKRKKKASERDEEEHLLDVYEIALGMKQSKE